MSQQVAVTNLATVDQLATQLASRLVQIVPTLQYSSQSTSQSVKLVIVQQCSYVVSCCQQSQCLGPHFASSLARQLAGQASQALQPEGPSFSSCNRNSMQYSKYMKELQQLCLPIGKDDLLSQPENKVSHNYLQM